MYKNNYIMWNFSFLDIPQLHFYLFLGIFTPFKMYQKKIFSLPKRKIKLFSLPCNATCSRTKRWSTWTRRIRFLHFKAMSLLHFFLSDFQLHRNLYIHIYIQKPEREREMADKPSRALVLYGDGLARFVGPAQTQLHSLASRALCGFLALPHSPPSGNHLLLSSLLIALPLNVETFYLYLYIFMCV